MSTRRRLSRQERRDVIERAATEVFAEHGYAGASIDEIARRSGVSAPVVYDHFTSKEDLYRRLLERQRDDLLAFWTRRLPLPEGEGALEGLLDAYYAYVEAHPFAYRMYFRDTAHPDVKQQGLKMLAALTATVPGFEDADEATLEMATEVLRTGLIGLALWWQEHPDMTREQVVRAAMRALSMGSAQQPSRKRSASHRAAP
jgi:AcrR family transcriptional regulator